MNSRKKMFYLAINQMSGFSLIASRDSDNRSIFSLIDMLIRSASGETMDDCRKPLSAVILLKAKTPEEKFSGCKLKLLQDSINTLFGGSKTLLSEQTFGGYNRSMLLEYLEVCRRIFITNYTPTVKKRYLQKTEGEAESETEIARKIRLAYEENGKKQRTEKRKGRKR